MSNSKGALLDKLRKAVTECERDLSVESAEAYVELKEDPLEALEVLTNTIQEVGDGFGRGELWLPDLIGSADAMQGAVAILDKEIKAQGIKKEVTGTVVAGTVFGDIHDMGKTILTTLLSASGFEVTDLGVNVSAQAFIEAVKEHTPDILAMSALLTTTIAEQGKVIDALKENKLREGVKIMVGGAAVSEEFAEQIGADGYEATASGAVELARTLIKRK
ncbi:hypothetical protein LCGC14_2761200 [marine sediment metagenome]|uniref:B12-binding domain-containing protein n=1 Tax=marine sediment metagenome TaxID=412755 RepID=A0A0F8YYW4_9ZZZZ|nr:cobalamin-binding protein [Spirochaetota bacterium]